MYIELMCILLFFSRPVLQILKHVYKFCLICKHGWFVVTIDGIVIDGMDLLNQINCQWMSINQLSMVLVKCWRHQWFVVFILLCSPIPIFLHIPAWNLTMFLNYRQYPLLIAMGKKTAWNTWLSMPEVGTVQFLPNSLNRTKSYLMKMKILEVFIIKW